MTKIVIDQAYVPGVAGIPEHYVDVGMHHGDYMKHGCFGYFYVGHNHGKYDKIAAVPAIPAIPEVSHVEGTYVDVTAQVAQMTSTANPHQSFAFNNAMNPGGIVNVAQDTVIVAIADPAYGQVKNVMIKYTLNGAEITLDTMEYETINL
jgi:hypothetical protein